MKKVFIAFSFLLFSLCTPCFAQSSVNDDSFLLSSDSEAVSYSEIPYQAYKMEEEYDRSLRNYKIAFYTLLAVGGASLVTGSILMSYDAFTSDDDKFEVTRPLTITGLSLLGFGSVVLVVSGIIYNIGRNKFGSYHSSYDFGDERFGWRPNLVASPEFTGATLDLRF